MISPVFETSKLARIKPMTIRAIEKPISRRSLLLSLPALATASRVMAQSSKSSPLLARKLSQMTLTVSDLKRSVDFYQGLFGMPIQARQGTTVLLRIGPGPQFMALKAGEPSAKPSIAHFGMSVDGFNADRIMKLLADHDVTAAGPGDSGLSGGPMKARVVMRDKTPELFLGDPDGIVIQLQDTSYCGGAGVLGNMCAAPEPAPGKGLLAVRDLSHFTLGVSNSPRSQAFYKEVFGLFIQAYQGPAAPVLGVGSGPQFIMAAGGGGGRGAAQGTPPPMGNIGHGCFSMQGFNPDNVLKALADYGVKPRGDAAGPAKPLVSYVSIRMENRGGAKEGTPELYFTDPDGILLQIQDVTYCGGAGSLGEVCDA
jgi:catechol 2,3-dioxygenase-like lactoylglutathione lyase family enzyme